MSINMTVPSNAKLPTQIYEKNKIQLDTSWQHTDSRKNTVFPILDEGPGLYTQIDLLHKTALLQHETALRWHFIVLLPPLA